MGAVESTAEENSIIRFVDSVEIRHEKEPTDHGKEHVSSDFVPEDKGNVQFNGKCEPGQISIVAASY